MAEVLKRGGAQHVWAVHGADGMDELSTTGVSRVVELKDGKLTAFDGNQPKRRRLADIEPLRFAGRFARGERACDAGAASGREGRSATSFS